MSSFSLLLITFTPPKKNGNFNNLFLYFPAKELPTAFPDLGLTYFKFFLRINLSIQKTKDLFL